jgi:hypothetical protein
VTGNIYLVKAIVNPDGPTPLVSVHGVPAWMMASRFRHLDDPAISWARGMVKESDIDDARAKEPRS